MDLITPQSFLTETGKDMPATQPGHVAEVDPLVDSLPSTAFLQVVEISADHPSVPETETFQSALPEGEVNPGSGTDPVVEILEGWSGMTASLHAERAGNDAEEISLANRWGTNLAGIGIKHGSTAPDMHQPADTAPDVPTDFKPAEPAAEFGKRAVTAASIVQNPDIDKDRIEPPASTHETELPPVTGHGLASQAPAVASDAANPASSDSSEGDSIRVTKPNPGPSATREAHAAPVPPAAGTDDPASYAASSEIAARNTGTNSVDSTAGIPGQKPIPPISALPDLSPPPPAISDQASASASEAGQQISTRSPLANTGSVLRQITDAVVTIRDEMVEIMLSPEELGRVRMVLTGHDRAPHLTIWAERPEILDQMRRNSDTLLQQFSDEGLADATLNFQGGRREDPEGKAVPETTAERGISDRHGGYLQAGLDHAVPVLPMRTGSQRIDIRM